MPKDKSKTPHYKVDAKSVSVNDPAEDLEPCVKFVVDNFEKWSDFWADKFTKFEKYYDQWIGVPPKRDEDWQANFHKRLTWQAEKTLTAKYHSALFPTSAPIETVATETTDETQSILAKSLVTHWFKIGLFSKEFLSAIRGAGIYGTALFEDGWYIRKEPQFNKVDSQIPDYRPMVDEQGATLLDENGNVRSNRVEMKTITQVKEKLTVVEDRYRVKKANIFSWIIHPNKLDDDDDYPVIKQEFITYNDLLDKQAEFQKYNIAGFENLDEIKEDKYKISAGDARRYQKEGEFSDDKNPRLEILSYWGLYTEQEGDDNYKKESKKRPMWIMVVNRKWKIKLAENPFWHKKPPLFHIVWNEDEKPSYYGIGLAQSGEDAEKRANNVVNTRTDIMSKTVKGSGWYNALDKKIKKSQVQSNLPGLMRACSDINNAFRYDVPPSPGITDYKEEEVAINDHREITGATTSLLPTADVSQQHKTLGGMEILVGQGLQRLKPDIVLMELMGIRKIANRALLLSRQFMSKDETIELIAPADKLRQIGLEKIYKMSPGQIIGSVNFHCTGLSETLDRQQNIEKLLKFVEIFSKNPTTAQSLNLPEIMKQISYWLGIEDGDKFINQMPAMLPGMQEQGQPQGMPGLPPGMPPPQGMLPPMPQGMPQQMPVPGGPQGIPPGLPPQILAMIAARIGQATQR